MSRNYDNWDRLVGAVLRIEQFRKLALRTPSSISSLSSSPSLSSSSLQIDESFESNLNDFMDENKRCLVTPEELGIAWGHDSRYWNWSSNAHSRDLFLKLDSGLQIVKIGPGWLDIRGKIKTRLLSPETTYAAFLVFKLADNTSCFEVANAKIRFVKDEQVEQAQGRATTVHLIPTRYTSIIGSVAVQRRDGWMEVQLGNFNFQDGYEGEVAARLRQTPRCLQRNFKLVGGKYSRYCNWGLGISCPFLLCVCICRFPEVAELDYVRWLDIRGKIKTKLLSPETTYAAFLVFNIADEVSCLEVANAMIRFLRISA